MFWVGHKAKEIGLVDGVGHIENIMKEKYGPKTKIKIIEQKKSFLQKKLSSSINSKIIDATDLINSLEEKAYWSKFGL